MTPLDTALRDGLDAFPEIKRSLSNGSRDRYRSGQLTPMVRWIFSHPELVVFVLARVAPDVLDRALSIRRNGTADATGTVVLHASSINRLADTNPMPL